MKKPETWTFYPASLPALLGWALLGAGVAGLALGMANARWRKEMMLLASWVAATILTFTLIPAKDGRYILIVAPAFVLATAAGLVSMGPLLSRISPRWKTALLLGGLAAGVWSAALLRMPQKSGFRAVASYLRSYAPGDAVLYDGYHDGLFGFYFRAFDPHYDRRLVLGQQLLYHYGPAATFDWVETAKARSTQDVANILRTQCGCRLVAVEVGPYSEWARGQRLLREAVAGPDFELVRSFPVVAPNAQRVDLYRLVGPIQPIPTVNVHIESFSNRTFPDVVPIAPTL